MAYLDHFDPYHNAPYSNAWLDFAPGDTKQLDSVLKALAQHHDHKLFGLGAVIIQGDRLTLDFGTHADAQQAMESIGLASANPRFSGDRAQYNFTLPTEQLATYLGVGQAQEVSQATVTDMDKTGPIHVPLQPAPIELSTLTLEELNAARASLSAAETRLHQQTTKYDSLMLDIGAADNRYQRRSAVILPTPHVPAATAPAQQLDAQLEKVMHRVNPLAGLCTGENPRYGNIHSEGGSIVIDIKNAPKHDRGLRRVDTEAIYQDFAQPPLNISDRHSIRVEGNHVILTAVSVQPQITAAYLEFNNRSANSVAALDDLKSLCQTFGNPNAGSQICNPITKLIFEHGTDFSYDHWKDSDNHYGVGLANMDASSAKMLQDHFKKFGVDAQVMDDPTHPGKSRLAVSEYAFGQLTHACTNVSNMILQDRSNLHIACQNSRVAVTQQSQEIFQTQQQIQGLTDTFGTMEALDAAIKAQTPSEPVLTEQQRRDEKIASMNKGNAAGIGPVTIAQCILGRPPTFQEAALANYAVEAGGLPMVAHDLASPNTVAINIDVPDKNGGRLGATCHPHMTKALTATPAEAIRGTG